MGIVLNALNVRSAEGYYYYGGRYGEHYFNEEARENEKAAPPKSRNLGQLYLPLAG